MLNSPGILLAKNQQPRIAIRLRAATYYFWLLTLIAATTPGSSSANFVDEERHVIPKFCNNTTERLAVILVHRDWYEPTMFSLTGWFGVPPRSCKDFVEIPKGDFFVYAASLDSQLEWFGSDYRACVAARDTRRSLFPNENCIAGEQPVGFVKINTDQRHFTYTVKR